MQEGVLLAETRVTPTGREYEMGSGSVFLNIS